MTTRNFNSFPILTTERLTLRQLSLNDQQEIFALRSDSEVNKYLGREPSNSIEDAITFINKINEKIKEKNSLYWVITITKTKTFVGTICLYDFLNETNSCEIGFELMTNFQGKGIMSEAVKKVIDYAFKTLNIKLITAQSHNENQNSNKLLMKLNFIQSKKAGNDNPDLSIFTLAY
jgi:ribosomal-protein-alanine N-acetyltransferase